MTDQVRAALEALLSQWDAEAGAMPDSRVRTVLQSCAMEVRAILLDPVIARAALAAASPEPERCATCGQSRDGLKHRCWSTHFRRVREAGDGLHVTTDCHPFQPAPAAPTVEALRAELVAKLTSGGPSRGSGRWRRGSSRPPRPGHRSPAPAGRRPPSRLLRELVETTVRLTVVEDDDGSRSVPELSDLIDRAWLVAS